MSRFTLTSHQRAWFALLAGIAAGYAVLFAVLPRL